MDRWIDVDFVAVILKSRGGALTRWELESILVVEAIQKGDYVEGGIVAMSWRMS